MLSASSIAPNPLFEDPSDLEKPMVFVVLKDGAGDEQLASELGDLVKTKIGRWKYPRWMFPVFRKPLPPPKGRDDTELIDVEIQTHRQAPL